MFIGNDLEKMLDKPIMDPYGRFFGRIVALQTNSKGEVTNIGVERANGEFASYPSEQISIMGEEAVFAYSWKLKAQETLNELNLAIRRIWALDQLLKDGEISNELYESGRKEKEAIIGQILNARKNLVSPLEKRIEKLKTQINEMQGYLTSMKIEHLSGQICDASYEATYEAIQRASSKALAEQKDLETAAEALMNPVQVPPRVVGQETSSFENTGTAKPSRPLVLRIKEAIS